MWSVRYFFLRFLFFLRIFFMEMDRLRLRYMGFDDPTPSYHPRKEREKYEDKYKQLLKSEIEREREREMENEMEKVPLLTTFIMEKTPIGNVVMSYNKKENRFEYYSDATIPYTYLDVVCRKFVIQNRCAHLFVDIEKEIKEVDLNKKEEKPTDKKSVFAKFKTYNDSSISKSAVPAKKNSIPNPALAGMQEKSKVLLKEKTNRYVHLGRFSAFSITQKIDRKAVVKRYATNYSDFKKIKS